MAFKIKDTTAEYRSAEYELDGRVYRFTAALWKPSPTDPQRAYFSLTGDGFRLLTRDPKGPRVWESGGCLHDALRALGARGALQGKDALLPGLIKWHLTDHTGRPMHYVENGVYLWQMHLLKEDKLPPRGTRGKYGGYPDLSAEYETRDLLAQFKSTVVWHEGEPLPEFDASPVELPRPQTTDRYVYEPDEALRRSKAYVDAQYAKQAAAVTSWLNARAHGLRLQFTHDVGTIFGREVME